jgi:predicted O-methyltransferase YrrM
VTQEIWSKVDRYVEKELLPPDTVMDAAVAESAAAGLPAIQVTPAQGKMLHLLARARSARAILEIGTLGGYSAIWLARALPPGGRLVTLELSPKHAEVARANLARAGMAEVTDVRVGPARDHLEALIAAEAGPFDLVFIDADKAGYPEYFELAMKLVRPGSVIVADNVVRDGDVVDANSPDPSVQGVRRLLALMAAEPRVDATVIQTVGDKGYDGFALAVIGGV